MKRLKQQTKTKAQIKEEGAQRFEKIGDKQIVGFTRVKYPNEKAVNIYELEDGKSVMEDDTGKTVAKMPQPPKRKKDEEGEG